MKPQHYTRVSVVTKTSALARKRGFRVNAKLSRKANEHKRKMLRRINKTIGQVLRQ